MQRPWNKEAEINDKSPWDEYGRFEDWIKSLLPDDESREYYDDAPAGFSSCLYAGTASAFDEANTLLCRPEDRHERAVRNNLER